MSLIIVAVMLITASMYGLSRLGWVQLNHMVQPVFIKTTDTSRHVATLDEGAELLLPSTVAEESILPEQTPPLVLPVSSNASPIALTGTSCAEQKQASKTKYESDIKEENDAYKAKKNKIYDDYMAKGWAFSYAQKKAQKTELERHNKVLKELEKNYKRELKQFDC